MVTTNSSRLPFTHIGKAMVALQSNARKIQLENVLHVQGRKKLVFVSQLTEKRNYIVFRLNEVKVYKHVKVEGASIMAGRKMDFVYVMSAKLTYVNKT